jgi:hypothetical protein
MPDRVVVNASPAGIFRVGSVLGKAGKLFFGRLYIFLPLALAPSLPALLFLILTIRSSAVLQWEWLVKWEWLVNLLAVLAAYPFVQGVISTIAIQHLRGRPASFAESLRVGITRLLPILGTSICSGFLVLLGAVLLIFPGLILFIRYYVAVPACVIDETGPLESMTRSAELTSGYRWQILGLLLFYVVITIIFGTVIVIIYGVAGIRADARVPNDMGLLVSQIILNGFLAGFGCVLEAVAYHDLRIAKDGIDTDRLALVFD